MNLDWWLPQPLPIPPAQTSKHKNFQAICWPTGLLIQIVNGSCHNERARTDRWSFMDHNMDRKVKSIFQCCSWRLLILIKWSHQVWAWLLFKFVISDQSEVLLTIQPLTKQSCKLSVPYLVIFFFYLSPLLSLSCLCVRFAWIFLSISKNTHLTLTWASNKWVTKCINWKTGSWNCAILPHKSAYSPKLYLLSQRAHLTPNVSMYYSSSQSNFTQNALGLPPDNSPQNQLLSKIKHLLIAGIYVYNHSSHCPRLQVQPIFSLHCIMVHRVSEGKRAPSNFYQRFGFSKLKCLFWKQSRRTSDPLR